MQLTFYCLNISLLSRLDPGSRTWVCDWYFTWPNNRLFSVMHPEKVFCFKRNVYTQNNSFHNYEAVFKISNYFIFPGEENRLKEKTSLKLTDFVNMTITLTDILAMHDISVHIQQLYNLTLQIMRNIISQKQPQLFHIELHLVVIRHTERHLVITSLLRHTRHQNVVTARTTVKSILEQKSIYQQFQEKVLMLNIEPDM